MCIELIVEAFLELKLVRLLARVSVDEAFQLARSEFFTELHSGSDRDTTSNSKGAR